MTNNDVSYFWNKRGVLYRETLHADMDGNCRQLHATGAEIVANVRDTLAVAGELPTDVAEHFQRLAAIGRVMVAIGASRKVRRARRTAKR